MGDDYKSFLIQAFTLLAIVVLTITVLLFLIKLFLKGTSAEATSTYIDFAKWAAVSIALIIIATIFDNNFKDRDAGLNEIKQYDNYVNLVVLNDRVGPKWRLSQYFSRVTASDKLRKRWEDYFELIDKEYKDSLNERLVAQKKHDSLENIVINNPNVDSTTKILLQQSKLRVQNLNNELDTKISVQQSGSGNLDDAAMWEKKGFDYLFDKDVPDAISAFGNADKSYPTFHSVYDIKKLLSSKSESLSNKNSDDWKLIFKTILDKYSWQLDPDIKNKLKEQ